MRKIFFRPIRVISLVVVVLLCGCSSLLSPEEEQVKEVTQQVKMPNEEQRYAEFSYYADRLLFSVNDVKSFSNSPFLDKTGNVVLYPMLMDGSFAKLKFVDGIWEKEPITWLEDFRKIFGDSQMESGSWWLGNDGCLYATFYYAEYEYGNPHLVKIEEESGEVTTVNLGGGTKVNGEVTGENFFNELSVFADGNLCVTGGVEISEGAPVEVYDGESGEKITDVELRSGIVTNVMAGDDFVAYIVTNEVTDTLQAIVCDEMTGKIINTIETEIIYNPKTVWTDIAFGVWGCDIVIACRDGIYEAEYGEKEFEKVVDASVDPVFYLQDEDAMFENVVYKNIKEEYMLNKYSHTGEGVNEKLCLYRPG